MEHVILEVICNLECEVKKPPESFALQVSGTSEYLEPLQSQLHDYEYVHSCYKYDRDPHFVLLPKAKMAKPYLRTVRTDEALKRTVLDNQNFLSGKMTNGTGLCSWRTYHPRTT